MNEMKRIFIGAVLAPSAIVGPGPEKARHERTGGEDHPSWISFSLANDLYGLVYIESMLVKMGIRYANAANKHMSPWQYICPRLQVKASPT